MMMREDCEKGFFVSFDYSSDVGKPFHGSPPVGERKTAP
jgi:hypothetical protein